jgi:hypothetical protein
MQENVMNRNFRNFGLSLSVALALTACSSDDAATPATSDVSIRFSDAPIGELTEVVITVDQLIFNREGEDVTVDTFTSVDLGIEESETFQIDLLQVQGKLNLQVLDSVDLPVGDYQNLRVKVLDQDTDLTYVMEKDGVARKQLKVPSGELKLGQFSVSNDSTQTFVVEFALNQAMTYNPGPDRYILKPRGVRVVRLEEASHISGTVDLANLHLREPCDDKADPSIGNVAYLYSGHDLNPALLGDLFIREDDSAQFPEFDENVPENIIQPLASAPIDGATEDYLFSYLSAGNYTLAISCLAETDDPVIFDQIPISAPADQIIELELNAETELECDFPDPESCTAVN